MTYYHRIAIEWDEEFDSLAILRIGDINLINTGNDFLPENRIVKVKFDYE